MGSMGVFQSKFLSFPICTLWQLANNSLIGSLPENFGNLRQLKFMDVYRNQLSGNIPTISQTYSSFRILSMARNKITGPIPKSLENLAALESLDLSFKNLSGVIPKELQNLQVLQMLNLSFNSLEGEVPTNGVFANIIWDSLQGNSGLCALDHDAAEKLRVTTCVTKTKVKFSFSTQSHYSNFCYHCACLCIVFSVGTSHQKQEEDKKQWNSFIGSQGFTPKAILLRNPAWYKWVCPRKFVREGSVWYGLGGKASTSGDVYSFGILLLEMIIAKKPTDSMFQEGLGLNKFISEVYKSKILDIADPRLFKDYKSVTPSRSSTSSIGGESSSSSSYNNIALRSEECVAAMVGVGLSCAAHSSKERVIPNELQSLQVLQMLNFSFNSLEGEVPKNGVFANISWDSLQGDSGFCAFDHDAAEKLRVTTCVTKKKSNSHLVLKVTILISAIIVLVCALCLAWALVTKKKSKIRNNGTSFVVKGLPPRLSYSEIQLGTNGYATENLLGKGAFGSVYRAVLSTGENGNQTTVAVKVLDLAQIFARTSACLKGPSFLHHFCLNFSLSGRHSLTLNFPLAAAVHTSLSAGSVVLKGMINMESTSCSRKTSRTMLVFQAPHSTSMSALTIVSTGRILGGEDIQNVVGLFVHFFEISGKQHIHGFRNSGINGIKEFILNKCMGGAEQVLVIIDGDIRHYCRIFLPLIGFIH
ncbi:hypothetical protein CMV_000641 [Castanea mollissima]|uniref:Protein kinase domain-containing protein n=1 Tax=Castanea mollissima TaxID=60419 RepID=A0A8J4S0X9_9ROSI|nr:hypothetical protein CMV_000641 [Castanea mollissima]